MQFNNSKATKESAKSIKHLANLNKKHVYAKVDESQKLVFFLHKM